MPSCDEPARSLATVVGPSGARYHCPDVEALDQRLDGLRERLRATDHPLTAERIRADIDALLDRRRWLTCIEG